MGVVLHLLTLPAAQIPPVVMASSLPLVPVAAMLMQTRLLSLILICHPSRKPEIEFELWQQSRHIKLMASINTLAQVALDIRPITLLFSSLIRL